MTEEPSFTAADNQFVPVERTDAIGRIVMDRPDHHNAMHEPMASELRDAVISLVEDDAVRCLVVTGTGGTFNTGADLDTLAGDPTDARRLRGIATRLHTAVYHLATAPKPVVTAINGVAAGGGLGLGLSGDVVLLADDARLEYAYTRIGLSGDGGSTYFLPRMVGYRTAREIALLDEPIDADTAADLGLVTETVPADVFTDRVAAVASQLAAGPTRAHAAVKRLLKRSDQRDLRGQLAAETDSLTRLTGTDDYRRGIEAFFENGTPEFTGK